VARGAHDEHVAKALIENDLGGHPAVGASEHHRGGLLRRRQPGAVLDALARVLGLASNKSLVTLLECFQAVTGLVLGMADIVPESAAVIDSRELSRWYERAQRDLPWRREGVTPWQILVSEFMLQQTPVARVEPIWLAWVTRWPTPSATAAASAADVLRAWGSSVIRGGPSGYTNARR